MKVNIFSIVFTIIFLSTFLIYPQRNSYGNVGDREIYIGFWNGDSIFYTNSLSIRIADGITGEDVKNFIENYNATIRFDYFELFRWGSIDVPQEYDVLQIIHDWISEEIFESVEPVIVIQSPASVDDPYYANGYQWALNNFAQVPPGGTFDADIDMPEGWGVSMGNINISISIIDSGIPMLSGQLSHPDLSNEERIDLDNSKDFTSNPPGVIIKDGYGHGTHVAGIISAETNNATGIAGVAGNCKLVICKIFEDDGYGTYDYAISAIYHSILVNVNIINMSFTFQTYSSQLEDAISDTKLYNILVIAAAGNNYGDVRYPAKFSLNYNNVIAVSSTDHNDLFSTYSNRGPEITVSAPGGFGGELSDNDVFSTLPNYPYYLQNIYPSLSLSYGHLWGTSMSTPHVSGVAALILSLIPNLLPSEVREIFKATADDKGSLGFDVYFGWGRINAYQATLLALAYSNKSTNYSATAHNNNHALERGFFGKLHEVFSSGEEIFYRRSTNNGDSWEITKRITTGNGSNSHPSIAAGNTGSTDILCLVWQKKIDSRHYDIMYSISSNMGTSWSKPEIVPGCANVWISFYQSSDYYGPGPTPVVASFVGDEQGPEVAFLLVYAAENGLHYRYSDEWYNSWVIPGNDIIPGSEGSSSKNWYPCLVTYNSQDYYHGCYRVNLTYDNRFNNVYSQIFNYLNGTVTWTSRVQVSSIGDNNRLSSIAVDYAGDRLAVWSGWNGNDFAIRFRKGFANGTWGSWYKEWSVSGVNSLCPSVTYYNKGGSYPYGIDILWYTESTNPAILNKRYSGTGDSWIPSDPFVQVVSLNSSFPNLTHERQNSILPLQIWTDQSAQPYSISYNTVFVPKEELFTGGEIHRAAEISDTSNNSYLRIELSEPIITLTDGDEIKIPFKTYNYFDTLDITTQNIFDYLKTELINIPNNAQSITFKVEINASQPDTLSDGTLNTDPQTPFRTINFGLVARDDSSHIILNNIGNRLLNNLSGIHHYSREFTINVSALRRRNVEVIPNINLSGIFNQNNLCFALVNISIEGDSLGKDSPQSDENNTIPNDFSLEQNYPNPFNPITQIDYSLVKDGLVTLKIFDVLGKEVTTLINEEKQAGTYTVLFNAGNLSSGIYFYQLKVKDFVGTKKMILLK